MRRDGLGKFYDRLTPNERFRLVVEAQARGDMDECLRLTESCPRNNYTMRDVAYETLVRASEEMVMVLCLDLAPRLAKIRILRAIHEGLPYIRITCLGAAHAAYFGGERAGMRLAWEAAGMEGNPPEPDEGNAGYLATIEDTLDEITARIEKDYDRFIALLTEPKVRLSEEARAIWEAFSRFSHNDLGLEPKKLVRMWFEPALSEIDELERLTKDIDLDGQKVEENEILLRNYWSKLVGGV
jgi:hypothetical protein